MLNDDFLRKAFPDTALSWDFSSVTSGVHSVSPFWRRLSHTDYIDGASLLYEYSSNHRANTSPWRLFHIHCIHDISLFSMISDAYWVGT